MRPNVAQGTPRYNAVDAERRWARQRSLSPGSLTTVPRSRCDRGNRYYCGRPCWRQARVEARRQTAQRYQRSWRCRVAHAQQSRRWRQRRAASDAVSDAGDDAQNVTPQGSQPGAAAAPLAAWTHDSDTVGLADTAADITTQSAPQQLAGATITPCWT
jgi:hypothetical protein